MKRLKELFYCALLTLMFTGCQSYKKVPYLQDAEVVLYNTQDAELYDAKIMPKDLLTIVVSCTSPELAAPFNSDGSHTEQCQCKHYHHPACIATVLG